MQSSTDTDTPKATATSSAKTGSFGLSDNPILNAPMDSTLLDTHQEEPAPTGYWAKRAQANAAKAAAAEEAREAEIGYVVRQMADMGIETTDDYPYRLILEDYESYESILKTENSEAVESFFKLFPNAAKHKGRRIDEFVTVQDLGPRKYRNDTIETMAEGDREYNGIFNGPAATEMKSNMRNFLKTCPGAEAATAIHYLVGAGGNLQLAADRYYHKQELRDKGMDSSELFDLQPIKTSQSFRDSHELAKLEPEPQLESSHTFEQLMIMIESLGKLKETELSIEVKNSIILIVLKYFDRKGGTIFDWRIITDLLNSISSSGKLTQRDIDTLYESISREYRKQKGARAPLPDI